MPYVNAKLCDHELVHYHPDFQTAREHEVLEEQQQHIAALM